MARARTDCARLRLAAAGLLLCCLWANAAAAEVFVWTDAKGRVHMTDDLSQVPPEYRRQAEAAGERAGDSAAVQQVEVPVVPVRRSSSTQAPLVVPAPDGSSGERRGVRVHVLQVERAGTSMRVVARLNERVNVPFIVDTGAEVCTLPSWALEPLGIEIDENTPRMALTGIGGTVAVPVVEIAHVQLGGASVESVQMAVLDSMPEGLLCLPFFNNFRVSTDPVRGLLQLEEIDEAALTGVYGGRNETSWRSAFRQRRAALERVRAKRAETREEQIAMHADIDREETRLLEQIEQLEAQATRLGVPREWRD
jgi:hypothetical protein